jgi:HSP20 family protein
MNTENDLGKSTAEQTARAERTRSGCCYRPNVDILEREDELLVLADMPGARSDAIDVKFEDGMLNIHAAVTPRHGDGEECLVHEYGVGDYYRSFQVSEDIDSGKIAAEYANGVLTLHLPKSEAAKPRKIAVSAV